MTVKLSSNLRITKLSDEVQGDGYAFEAVILSGEPIDRWWGRFVIDLASVTTHKPRLTVDYNHNDEQIIGFGENFQGTPEGFKSTGKLIAGTYADEIIKLAKQGVPFEASVSIDLENAVETRLGADAQTEVNGKTYSGPLSIYSNVPLEGYAICPHGADKYTNFTLLKKEIDFTMPKILPKKTKLSGDAPDPEDAVKSAVKSQELDELCAIFGTTNGVTLFQQGTDVAEVKQWQSLNEKYAQYLAGSEDGKKDEPASEPDDTKEEPKEEPASEPDKKDDDKLSAALTKLNKTIDTQSQTIKTLQTELVKLKAAVPRGAEPVSHLSETQPAETGNSVTRYAERYKK
jgi:hypothetical protein